MNGKLIVNGFLQSAKFNEIYGMFEHAFAKRKVKLQLSLNSDFPILFNGENSLQLKNTLLKDTDFVLFFDKDVMLAQCIEDCNVKIFNTAKAILNCDDKRITAYILNKHKIPTPQTIIAPKTFQNVGYAKKDFIFYAGQELGYPLIIKEAFGSFGQQVYLAQDFNHAQRIVEKIGGREFLFQKFIWASKGKDARVNVVGDKVIAVMERFNQNDFRSNVSNGGSMRQIEVPQEFCDIAIRSVKALRLDFAGVDVLTDQNGQPLICEVNSNPHFKSTYECTGIDMSESIADYVLQKLGGQND